MLNSKWFACSALALAAALSGCSSTGDKDANAGANAQPVAPTSTGSVATTSDNGSANGTAPVASQSVVYFDFDSSDIKPEGQAVVAAWAKYLVANPTVKVQLQGNTDERGTREYNMSLGERRSKAVGSALEAAGVSSSQLNLVSFGEEKPVALGHDEAAWSQNRRCEIVAQ